MVQVPVGAAAARGCGHGHDARKVPAIVRDHVRQVVLEVTLLQGARSKGGPGPDRLNRPRAIVACLSGIIYWITHSLEQVCLALLAPATSVTVLADTRPAALLALVSLAAVFASFQSSETRWLGRG